VIRSPRGGPPLLNTGFLEQRRRQRGSGRRAAAAGCGCWVLCRPGVQNLSLVYMVEPSYIFCSDGTNTLSMILQRHCD
jgi:hypothetical protein